MSSRDWKSLVEEWRISDESQKAFCLERGLDPRQFNYHKRQEVAEKKAEPKFQEISVETDRPVPGTDPGNF